MRKTVIFTMILTVIFATVGCTSHSELNKKAVESSSANAVIDTRQAEELTEKTENETVDKSTFAEETTQCKWQVKIHKKWQINFHNSMVNVIIPWG